MNDAPAGPVNNNKTKLTANVSPLPTDYYCPLARCRSFNRRHQTFDHYSSHTPTGTTRSCPASGARPGRARAASSCWSALMWCVSSWSGAAANTDANNNSSQDGLLASRILATLFRQDDVPYRLVPIGGYAELQAKRDEVLASEELHTLLLLSLGSLLNLADYFELPPNCHLHIIDAHRPWNLDNLFGLNVDVDPNAEANSSTEGTLWVWGDGEEAGLDGVKKSWEALEVGNHKKVIGMLTQSQYEPSDSEDDSDEEDDGDESEEEAEEDAEDEEEEEEGESDEENQIGEGRIRKRRREGSAGPKKKRRHDDGDDDGRVRNYHRRGPFADSSLATQAPARRARRAY